MSEHAEQKKGDTNECTPTSLDAQAFGYTCKNDDPEHMKVCSDFALLNAMVERRKAKDNIGKRI